jgi:hypothetical protein
VQEGGDIEPQVTSQTITLTAASLPYRVQLRAFNQAGSVASGIGSFVLADVPEAPAAPVNDAAVTTSTSIRVTFADPLPNARGSPVLAIQLAMDDGLGGDFVTVLGADEAVWTLHTSYTASVVKGREYRFRCRARNSIGWSTWSSPDGYIRAAVVPAKPEAPSLISATSTTISLQLTIPSDSGGSPFTAFSLFINDGNDANEATTTVSTYTLNANTHSLSVAADGLTTGLIYKFRFRATNAVGNSEYSDTVRFALVDTPTAPSAPSGLAQQTSESQIGFEWLAIVPVTGQETGQAILGYLAYMMEVNAPAGAEPFSLSSGEFVLVYNGTNFPDTTSVLLRSLNGTAIRAGYEYQVKVKAVYLNGVTAESSATSIRACSTPSIPSGAEWAPALGSTSSTAVSLTWSEPT